MAETDKDDLVTIIDEEDHQDIVPDTLPLMPVRDVVIFTDMLLPLFVGRKKSIRAVEEALSKDGYLLLATQKDPNVEDPAESLQSEDFKVVARIRCDANLLTAIDLYLPDVPAAILWERYMTFLKSIFLIFSFFSRCFFPT